MPKAPNQRIPKFTLNAQSGPIVRSVGRIEKICRRVKDKPGKIGKICDPLVQIGWISLLNEKRRRGEKEKRSFQLLFSFSPLLLFLSYTRWLYRFERRPKIGFASFTSFG